RWPFAEGFAHSAAFSDTCSAPPMKPPFGSFPSARLASFGPFVLRLVLAVHLIQGTQDNVFSWARMLEFREFLAAEGFPVPLACAIVSVAAQFGCGILYIVGAFVHWAAAVMLVNFAVALLGVHLGDPYHAWFPAWMMWAGSLALLF